MAEAEHKSSVNGTTDAGVTASTPWILVRIDGNIGAGKSTLIEYLSKRIPNSEVIPEPVKHWTTVCDTNGKNILQAFYEDKTKYACVFQIFAFVTRLQTMRDAMDVGKPSTQVWLTERSVHSDAAIFAKTALEEGTMNELEYKLYEDIHARWIDMFARRTQPDLTLYVRTPPQICKQRIASRGRREERDNEKKQNLIADAYLAKLHDKHEEWLATQKDVVVIDGTRDYRTDEEELRKLTERIQGAIDAKLAVVAGRR